MTAKTITYPQKWLDKIESEAIYSTKNGLPGAVVSINIDGQRVYQKAFGFQRMCDERTPMPNPEPMRTDTIFDMASLTKIFSTTLSYMKLVNDKLISIDDKVSKYLPAFSGGDKDSVTIRHLMQHNSGLPAVYQMYDPAKVPSGFYSQCRTNTLNLLPQVPLAHKPGTVTVYSDINFASLGAILEKVTQTTQDEFVLKNIYQPLGLQRTGYKLLDRGIPRNQFEATERCGNTRDGNVTFPNVRTTTIQGQVQDEFAFYSMEQVSGNAGLFSTADDLTVLAQLILNGGSHGGYTLCSPEVVQLFTTTLNIDKSYALGFQIPSINTQLIYGMLLPEGGNAVGHTGWTGNCFLLDFQHKSIIIILTNKKHTPVIPVSHQDLNHFEGDLLPTAVYGTTMHLFYAGFLASRAVNP